MFILFFYFECSTTRRLYVIDFRRVDGGEQRRADYVSSSSSRAHQDPLAPRGCSLALTPDKVAK